MKSNQYNPFVESDVAQEWITQVEKRQSYLYDKEFYPCIKRWLSIQSGALLDVGCGTGELFHEISSCEQIDYYGVDSSELLIAYARDKTGLSSDIIRHGWVENLPFKDSAMAVAVSVNVFMHIPDLVPALVEVARVLKSGGSFLCITSNPFENELWRTLYFNQKKLPDGGIIGSVETPSGTLHKNTFYFHTFADWQQAASKAGLELSIREENLGKLRGKERYIFTAFELERI